MTDLQERASKAVKAFRAMIPGLTGYAQAITGRPNIRVEVGTTHPYTDGQKIYYRPPLALGDPTLHERRFCDKRDAETYQLICPACRVREMVLSSIYHEMSHIIFESTISFTKRDVIAATIKGLKVTPKPYREAILERFASTAIDISKPKVAASLVSPYLPTLYNALEDVRVDNSMFKVRRGIKSMHRAKAMAAMKNGVEQPDGTSVSWGTRPRDIQAVIAVLLLGMEMPETQQYLDPEIEVVFNDEQLDNLCKEVIAAGNALEVYMLSIRVLARLRELGFCHHPEDPTEEEPEDEQEGEQSESESAEDESAGQDQEASDEVGTGSDSGGTEESDEPRGATDSGAGREDESTDSGPHDDRESNSGADASESEGEDGEADSDSAGSVDSDRSDEDGAGGEEAEVEPSDSSSGGEEEDRSDAAGDQPNDSTGGLNNDDNSSGDWDHSEEERSDVLDGGDDAGAEGESDGSSGRPDAHSVHDSDSGGDTVDHEASASDSDGADEDGTGDAFDPDESWELAADADDKEGLKADPPLVDIEELAEDIEFITGHGAHQGDPELEEAPEEQKAVAVNVIQGKYFETPSTYVTDVRIHKFGQPNLINGREPVYTGWSRFEGDYRPVGEDILGPALLEMRRAFQDNARSDMQRHLKAGRVDASVLGKRAWAKDPRLFQKKRVPGKRSYAVLLGLDISGSTHGHENILIRRAARAQADLCDRLGVKFSVLAHTATAPPGRSWRQELGLDIYEVKRFEENWGDGQHRALAHLQACAENLDGHTLEYYRKAIEKVPATNKIILYYTDGEMPAANYDEELSILQREIKTCKKLGITLLGVGIKTNSPADHGLDTVQIDRDEDLVKVVRHLEKALVQAR